MYKAVIRVLAFLRKEIFIILRQPKLLLTLVLGPFLILLIFGIGYRNQPRSLRTLFVAREGSALGKQIAEYADTLGPQLIYEGVTSDAVGALQRLRDGEVDLVAVAPEDAYESIQDGRQATFVLYNQEIDPLQKSYMQYFGQVYIDEVNRRVLLAITEQGQQEAGDVEQYLNDAQNQADRLDLALNAGDAIAAQNNAESLGRSVDKIALAAGASLQVLTSVENTLGLENSNRAGELLSTLNELRATTDQLDQLDPSSTNLDEQKQELDKVQSGLDTLQSRLDEFTSLDPQVIVRPFKSETKSVAEVDPKPADFYAPAVIALLLQHLAVTTAALSIVREQNLGALELFQIAPVTAGETLFGKYLSFMLLGAVLAAILTVVLVFLLDVPMLGNWWLYALIVLVLLFTSLSIGFVISLVSQTDSQAVQLTMIVLLASVFFSGFITSLDLIWRPVRVFSWSLPTTYGVVMMRDIFLRGNPPTPLMLGGLAGIGLGLCLLAWYLHWRKFTYR